MNIKISKLALVTACIMATGTSYQSYAAEEQLAEQPSAKKAKQKDTDDEMEVIMVSGFRGSLIKSLATKRDAQNVVDAISAEDVGKLPDVNIAEALQRIAGITVSRENGQGKNISVRGLTGGFNLTTLNGRKLATDNAGRNFNYDVLSSGIISSIEVSKTPKAELTEGGIGAIVDIKTVRPLHKQGTEFIVSAEAVQKDLADETNPKGSVFFSQNIDDTFGIAAGLIYSETSGRYDYVNIPQYQRDIELNIGSDPENYTQVTGDMPTAVRYNTSKTNADRTSINLALQWRPSSDWDINLDGLYSTYDFSDITSGIALGLQQPFYPNHGYYKEADVDSNGNFSTITTTDPFLIDLLHIENHRVTTTEAFGLNVEWVATDELILTGDISYSSAKNENGGDNRFVVARSAIQEATYDNSRNGDVPDMIFSRELDATAGFGAHYTLFYGLGSEDEVEQASLKGKWMPDIAHLSSLDFGIGFTGQTKSRDNWRAPNASAFSNGKIDGVEVTDDSLLIENNKFTWIQIPESIMLNSDV